MIGPLKARLTQGFRTINYPHEVPVLPERFRGLPHIDAAKCMENCNACIEACPVAAIEKNSPKITLDMGKCIFCGECARVCEPQAVQFTRDHRMACFTRRGLEVQDEWTLREMSQRAAELHSLLGRSMRLRQVSAGGCNACEADTNVLGTITYDLGRFGIQFVASPRHADGILVTGPVSRNMESALRKTYEAVPDPKVVIAVGACAISGGIFAGHAEVVGGITDILPVDLFVPGCPPHPLTILDGLLRLVGKIR